jgi:AcrR family transcriptional regulator
LTTYSHSVASQSSRQAIAKVAARLFAEHGYAGTSLRQIAGETGLDAALIIRYFGSKESLFLETISLDGRFTALFDGPLEELGHRVIVGLLTDADASTLDYFSALVRCSDLNSVPARLRATSLTGFLEPLIARLPGPNAPLRARLVLAQINGLLLHLGVVVDPLLRALTAQELADAYAPALQALIND